MSQQQCTTTHARAGQRRLGAGVTATDYDYVKFFRILRHWMRCDLGLPPAPRGRARMIAQFDSAAKAQGPVKPLY
jgi:hypothetical protein